MPIPTPIKRRVGGWSEKLRPCVNNSPLPHIFVQVLPYIYVYETRRDCKDIINCIEVPSIPTSEVKAVIPLNDPIVFTERMYNNPITHVGPELEDVILPYTIHLRKKK